MATRLTKPCKCRNCRELMPAGTHVRGTGSNTRHYDTCPRTARLNAAAAAAGEPLATERQVAYLRDLVRANPHGHGVSYQVAPGTDLETLTCAEASRLISAYRQEW